MIYFCLNRSGLLDPVLENIQDKYPACVVYWNGTAWDKIKQAPFFSDKWLLIISGNDLLLKENAKVLENRFNDIVCEVSSQDELNKVVIYAMSHLEEYCLDSNKLCSRLTASWEVDKQEFDEILSDMQNFKVISAYKLDNNYFKTYIKWWLFTREGNQYGENTKDLTPGQRWIKAKEMELNTLLELNLDYLSNLVKGNEGNLLTALNLLGIDILNTQFLLENKEYFPKVKYVTVNNFPLYLFANDRQKKKEILNLVYSYRHNFNLLKKSLLNWCETFEKIHKAFSCGELSVKTKDTWFSSQGYALGINSSFKAKLWWKCVNNISLERIYILRAMLDKSQTSGYAYLVNLCRKEL